MEALRGQVVEEQKSRTDLIKWKLILAAALGGVGFGVGAPAASAGPPVDLVMCLIPLTSAYVDLLCSHMALRVRVIATFTRLADPEASNKATLKRYEQFVETARRLPTIAVAGKPTGARHTNVLGLGPWAMYGASTMLSILVALYGVWLLTRVNNSADIAHAVTFFVACAVGLVAVWRIYRSYDQRFQDLRALKELP